MKPRPVSFASPGVDLVEFARAKDFYRRHRLRLGSFFTAAEIRFIQKSRPAYKALARLLAAKEAAFKATNSAWMGPEGFRSMRVVPVAGDFRVSGKGLSRIPVTFLEKKDAVIACVHAS